MTVTRLGRRLAPVLLAVALAACGGGGSSGPGGDPVSTVNAVIQAFRDGRIDTLGQYACAANQGGIASMLGGAMGALPSGASDLLKAMRFSFGTLDVKQTSLSGDTATVHIAGTRTVIIDDAALRTFARQMLANQGQQVDDATLNMALAAMKSQLSQSQAVNQDVTLKNEGGRWLVCS